ncbi:IS3 family transposase [bacterium]|nr:IS3 family transposase [bacterium]
MKRCEFIQAHETEHPVKLLCEMMKIRRSGYYAWRQREPGERMLEDVLLKRLIQPVFIESQETYGSRRLQSSLKKAGISSSRRRVRRLMMEEGLMPKQMAKWHPPTTQADETHEKAPNLLARDFRADHPNQKWVVDITYIPTREGWLYLAVILDLFSRAVVGWSMKKRMTKALVIDAWKMACAWRHPPELLLHHSDLGSQYTSTDYLDLLRESKCLISMSGKGNCYDNACVESFFSTLKGECVDRIFETRSDASNTIFQYIEVWYNRKRLHSTLDYQSPLEFELRGECVH